ncbi:MAG: hypothetical protein IT364_20445 [Candidatus Hydrogenedentes bacterium]|nr:hypothetical protein [Candidatus Hydrogenedentota bacterium]
MDSSILCGLPRDGWGACAGLIPTQPSAYYLARAWASRVDGVDRVDAVDGMDGALPSLARGRQAPHFG